ncbi:MAG TPA: hypothetical protein PKC26_03880, partial [Plasticicumulans sp.]|nr:hypothetical protein [Plasticicumulans sp.]
MNQRQPLSCGRPVQSVVRDWVLRSQPILLRARQPSQGKRLCVWSTDRRRPLSVEAPTPSTSFC